MLRRSGVEKSRSLCFLKKPFSEKSVVQCCSFEEKMIFVLTVLKVCCLVVFLSLALMLGFFFIRPLNEKQAKNPNHLHPVTENIVVGFTAVSS